MKITKNRLKQIIKEEIEALGDERGPSAEDYRKKIEGFADALKMVENAPDELKKAMKHSIEMSVDSVLKFIADDSLRDGVKKLVEALLGSEYLPDDPEYLPDDMNESIGGLMDKVGYEKARDAIESAIDFDEEVRDMDDLKDLIKTLRSEKDPMGKDRKEELSDIKNALKDALSNKSEAMSSEKLKGNTKMNITKEQLKRIIKEEIGRFLNEDKGTYIDLSGYSPEVVLVGNRYSIDDMIYRLWDANHPLGLEKPEDIIDDGRAMEVVNAFLNMKGLNPDEVEKGKPHSSDDEDEYYSSDEYKQKQREKDKKGVENELILGMGISEDIITDDLLNAIMAHEDYIPGESIDADATGFITADEVKRLADKLELKKKAERSYLSEKLKRIIKEEIENLSK